MASITRLARTFRTISPPFPRLIPPPLVYHAKFEQHRLLAYASEPKQFHKLPLHMALAGFLGFGLLDVAYADSDEPVAKTPSRPETANPPPQPESAPETASPPPHPESAPEIANPSPQPESAPETANRPPQPESANASAFSIQNLDEIAKGDKARLEELLKSKGGYTGFYPRFIVSVKGGKVSIRFLIPLSCEIPRLIATLVSRLGVKPQDGIVGSDMILRSWDNEGTWQLIFSPPKTQKQTSGDQPKNNNGELRIVMFRLRSSDKAIIEFSKPGSFTFEELDALATVLKIAGQPRNFERRPMGDTAQVPTMDKTISSLEGMGVKIYGLKVQQSNAEHEKVDISWDNIAGYYNQKRGIEDAILLALKSPEIYDNIARETRCKFESNRPRAVLFEGPPGTGKTSCARVIANGAGVPMLYVPLEIIMSKYYGESERLLGKVFSLAKQIPDGAIIFLDEVDAVATARDTETHEATTRRLLSVLLRQIDGFEQEKKVVVIAATNRKQDLDPALHSRFDCIITFGLPDHKTREAIIAQYAKHLTKSDLAELASATEEMSGRDIRDVCQQAERSWASKIIRGQEQGLLPPLGEYIESALERRRAMDMDILDFRNRMFKKSRFDFL